jgi:hypothetical protein
MGYCHLIFDSKLWLSFDIIKEHLLSNYINLEILLHEQKPSDQYGKSAIDGCQFEHIRGLLTLYD